MNLDKMKKESLINYIKELEEKIEKLENDIDYYINDNNEKYNNINNLKEEISNLKFIQMFSIKDAENFKYRLSLDNLLTPELENFIKFYMMFYNDFKR